jgi:hypothetical protein
MSTSRSNAPRLALDFAIFVYAGLLASGCGSEPKGAEDQEDTSQGALESAMSTSALATACRTLGAVSECDRVTVCEVRATATCKATDGARASNPDWERMCPQAGADETQCALLSRYCHWDSVSQCVPRAGAPGGATDAQGTDRQVTCKLLGAINQCGQVSLCKATADTRCQPKGAYAADIFWKDYCPQLSAESTCAIQSNCRWESAITCSPIAE